MSGKDFMLIANVIRTFHGETRHTMMARFIVKFEATYPRFDKTRFIAAIERED